MSLVEEFCTDLKSKERDLDFILSKYLILPRAYFFSQTGKNIEDEINFRLQISKAMNVPISNIVITGSAMTGFALNPKKNLRKFDSVFEQTREKKHKSDIDVAIISDEVFNSLANDVYGFTDSFKENWTTNLYHRYNPNLKFNLLLFLARGWFRPDYAPKGFLEGALSGYSVKDQLYRDHNRKISFAFYKSWSFYESVHMDNLKNNILPSVLSKG